MNTSIRMRAIGLLCCLMLTHWAFSQTTTRYVSTTGITPAASATSWATSTTDLQGAIDASQPGDQVWVVTGLYKPTPTTGPDSRTISFSMKNGVAIYGGFAGGETSLSQRPTINPVAGKPGSSTLSGDIDNDGTLTNNSYHVISNPTGLTTTAVLDGFVITGGNASGSSANMGGGMYNNGSSPTLTNCLFVDNQATGGNGNSNKGGAIYNNGSSPTLTNCSFQGNQATGGGANHGGAMYNESSSPTLTNCSFQNNQATGGGGSANYGGAMYNFNGSNPTLTNCSFQGNQITGGNGSSTNGGAIYNNGSSPTLTNCSFQNNQATGNRSSNYGGAMYNTYSNPTLTNCSFQGNQNTGTASVDLGWAMYNFSSHPVLTNTVMWNNGGSNTFFNNGSTLTARYSLFDNTSGVDVTGPGNLTTTTSPFVSATSVALLPCSPAVNAGDPNTTTATVGTTDLAGNPRFFGGRIDMGAVEYQARLYVAASQTANVGDGQSWATAFPDLQSALTYPCSQNLTEIWVAAGTYKPARGSSFSMLPGVAIYGGFKGLETSLSERPAVNPVTGHPSNTTLAGNGSRVITNPSGLTTTAVLDGFIITGGNASVFPNNLGGGVYNNGIGSGQVCNPSFRNCSLIGNSASSGGAMYNDGNGGQSSPVLTNCVLQSNMATLRGGAMYNHGPGGQSSPVLTNCVLQGNQATGIGAGYLGGAMYNDGDQGQSNPVLTNCVLQNNSAYDGGAMYNSGWSYGQSSPVLTNCVLQSNSAIEGGAMFNYGTNGQSSPVLTNCSLLGNSAIDGGAMFNIGIDSQSRPVLTNSILWNNGGNAFVNLAATGALATYSLFDNPANVSISGPGNFTSATSPFVSATSAALNSCAFAIGSADPTTTTVMVGTTDLAGNARFTSARLDMGAYQYQGVVSGQVRAITVQPVAGSVVCAGTPVAVPVSATGIGTSFSYQWYKGTTALTSQTAATLTLPTASTADAGSYSVVVTGACNSVTSTVFSLSVNALPSVTVTAAPSATLSCTNPSLTLTAQTSATSFTWSSGGSTGQTLPVSTTGVYSVTATGSNGCTAVSNNLTISRDNTSPTVSVSALSNTLNCIQSTLTLTATASVTALRWSTGHTTTTISVSQTGTYSVTATGANGCTAVSNNLLVTANFSLPPFTVSSATVCPGQSVNLTASGCSGQILWSTGATTAMITLTAGSSTSLLTANCTVSNCSTSATGQVVIGGALPPPAQILSFTADESTCPVRLTGRGVATSFTMTGPKDYVFSTVYREGATHDAVGLNVKQAGTYTLTATYTNSCGTSEPVTRTVTVGRNCP
nr:choice-of-anchor Q domain-containing protein [uncultured Arsenicibacter sp.]